MVNLDGKAAIVTGAGRGIGRGIASALAAAGSSVVLAGRTQATLQEAAAEIQEAGGQSLCVVCDITIPADLENLVGATVAKFGTVDILVNNAAYIPHGPILTVPEEELQRGWDSGPLATLRLMRLCHPHLAGGGAIVNMSSTASLGPSASRQAGYGAIKAALNVISRMAAEDWGRDGIRVNQVMPWAMSDAVESWMATQPEDAARMLERTPLGRLGDPRNDIGAVVAFLCSDEARYVTGTTVPVDGGRTFLR